MYAARTTHSTRPIAALLACALGVGRSVFAPPVAAAPVAGDPVQVFYTRKGCLGDRIQLGLWDRAGALWRRHPVHPEVPLETCQIEDAGVLLNEIRWRCIEAPGDQLPAAWVVGLDVFDSENQWIERDWRVDFHDSLVVERQRAAALERMRREQRAWWHWHG